MWFMNTSTTVGIANITAVGCVWECRIPRCFPFMMEPDLPSRQDSSVGSKQMSFLWCLIYTLLLPGVKQSQLAAPINRNPFPYQRQQMPPPPAFSPWPCTFYTSLYFSCSSEEGLINREASSKITSVSDHSMKLINGICHREEWGAWMICRGPRSWHRLNMGQMSKWEGGHPPVGVCPVWGWVCPI